MEYCCLSELWAIDKMVLFISVTKIASFFSVMISFVTKLKLVILKLLAKSRELAPAFLHNNSFKALIFETMYIG